MFYLDIIMDKVRRWWSHAVPSWAFGSEDPAPQVQFLHPFGCHLGQKLQPLSSLTVQPGDKSQWRMSQERQKK